MFSLNEEYYSNMDYQHTFYNDPAKEEFYVTPTPSEDIWKKFQLMPTPPSSPEHDTTYTNLVPSNKEKLKLVSELLDENVTCTNLNNEICIDDNSKVNLNSKLIQDCMWSCLNIARDFKLANLNQVPVKINPNSILKSNVLDNQDNSIDIPSNCVDPSSIFPYPINRIKKSTNLSYGLETPSESCDSEDEIDVVTVNDKTVYVTQKSQLSHESKISQISDQQYDEHPYGKRMSSMPRASSPSAESTIAIVTSMHNYNAPNPSSKSCMSMPCSTPPKCDHKRGRRRYASNDNSPISQPPVKKLKISIGQDNPVIIRKLISPNSSSDSEEGDFRERRAQHNVLERKRRNDLKSSFLRLRDIVPDLSRKEKTPKVTILRKATDYILSLRREEKYVKNELEKQQHRRQQLVKKLQYLRSQN